MDYAKDIFEIFIETYDEEFTKLRETVKSKSCRLVKAAAHKMKPTFSMVGLTEFTDHFKNLETLALQDNISAVQEAFAQVDQQLNNKIPLVKKEFDRITQFVEANS